jgi:glycosyltransferase involved in cell wall biosynthesis
MVDICYITELSLPSNKAQSVHIFKMLDNFSSKSDKITLLCPYKDETYNYLKFKKNYNLHSNKKINIETIFKKKNNNNIFRRVFFSIRCLSFVKKKNQLIISRSLFSSFFMSIFSIHHFLEIHQEIKGLSNFIFIKLNFINSKFIIKNLFISKGIYEHYNSKVNNFAILHDGADTRDFKIKYNPNKKIKNLYYFGSFYKGRGIEFLAKLSAKCPKYNFHAVGKRNENTKIYSKNFKIYPFMSFKKILNFYKRADILLMPYQKQVSINSENFKDDISEFMSPIKMFEYLATGIPIISSEKKVLKEILINFKNCIFVKKYQNISEWKKTIETLDKNKELRFKISKNAISTVKKFTWRNRVVSILEFYDSFKKSK